MREGERLSAVLVAGYLRDDLRRDVAGSEEAVRLLDQSLADDGSVLQHILKVDEVAVVLALRIIVGVVEMDDALLVSLDDLLREQYAARQILADFARHIVALRGVDDRVFVGILLLDLLICLINQGENALVGCVGLTSEISLVTVAHVFLRDLKTAHLHDSGLDHLLDVLDVEGMRSCPDTGGHIVRDCLNLEFVHLVDPLDLAVRLRDGIHDFLLVKGDLLTASLDDIYFYLGIAGFRIFHSRNFLSVFMTAAFRSVALCSG